VQIFDNDKLEHVIHIVLIEGNEAGRPICFRRLRQNTLQTSAMPEPTSRHGRLEGSVRYPRRGKGEVGRTLHASMTSQNHPLIPSTLHGSYYPPSDPSKYMITDNSHFVVFCKLDHWVEGKTSSGATDGNYVSEKNFGYNLKITDTWKPRTHGNHGHMDDLQVRTGDEKIQGKQPIS